MFFTKLARVLAYLIFIMGILRVAVGLFIAVLMPDDPAAVARYLGNVENTGEGIDRGVIMILVGVVLGVMTDISRSSQHRADTSHGSRTENQ